MSHVSRLFLHCSILLVCLGTEICRNTKPTRRKEQSGISVNVRVGRNVDPHDAGGAHGHPSTSTVAHQLTSDAHTEHTARHLHQSQGKSCSLIFNNLGVSAKSNQL